MLFLKLRASARNAYIENLNKPPHFPLKLFSPLSKLISKSGRRSRFENLNLVKDCFYTSTSTIETNYISFMLNNILEFELLSNY